MPISKPMLIGRISTLDLAHGTQAQPSMPIEIPSRRDLGPSSSTSSALGCGRLSPELLFAMSPVSPDFATFASSSGSCSGSQERPSDADLFMYQFPVLSAAPVHPQLELRRPATTRLDSITSLPDEQQEHRHVSPCRMTDEDLSNSSGNRNLLTSRKQASMTTQRIIGFSPLVPSLHSSSDTAAHPAPALAKRVQRASPKFPLQPSPRLPSSPSSPRTRVLWHRTRRDAKADIGATTTAEISSNEADPSTLAFDQFLMRRMEKPTTRFRRMSLVSSIRG